MNIFPENTVLNEITDFTDRNVDIFSTKSNLWNKSDNDSKLLDHHLFGKLEQNQNFKKVERNSPTNKSTLSLHITAYENGIIENSENTINVFNATQSKFDFGFEFPRQQDDGNGAPDGMQFKSNQKLLDPNGADDEQSEEDDKKDVISATPQEIIDEINSKGETIVQEWHKTITKNPPKIDAFLDLNNATKNRFPNVLLYDSTRVRIKDKHGSDYYHASHVDAFGKPGKE
uniref:Tyrosine-protein phosphatase domain-containing protein n=1 Tax=Panagrolaimus davidi TaxID=227884 RepID=A0A914QPQ6_9BILA